MRCASVRQVNGEGGYSFVTWRGSYGYCDYTSVESIFEMVIPGDNEALLAGLEDKRNR
jgi:hypothetical protein